MSQIIFSPLHKKIDCVCDLKKFTTVYKTNNLVKMDLQKEISNIFLYIIRNESHFLNMFVKAGVFGELNDNEFQQIVNHVKLRNFGLTNDDVKSLVTRNKMKIKGILLIHEKITGKCYWGAKVYGSTIKLLELVFDTFPEEYIYACDNNNFTSKIIKKFHACARMKGLNVKSVSCIWSLVRYHGKNLYEICTQSREYFHEISK